MLGHADPVQIRLRVAPGILRKSTGLVVAGTNGRGALSTNTSFADVVANGLRARGVAWVNDSFLCQRGADDHRSNNHGSS